MTVLAQLLLPGPEVALAAGGAGLLCCVLFGPLAAGLRRRGTRVAYTRKVFHFGVFTAAGAVHLQWGLPATNTFGAVVAACVLWAVARGDGHGLYEALARETDRPCRGAFVILPLLTTAVGGLVSAALTGPFAAVGYLVTGWGDAVGEPAGALWGRHPYRVPSLFGVTAHRTWEGTAAVWVASLAAALVSLWALGLGPAEAIGPALAVAAAAALVEGISTHGLDNLTVQLAASLVAVATVA